MQCTCVVHAVMHVHFRPGNNSWLDALRFVPICTVVGMEAVLRFPSYGELSDTGSCYNSSNGGDTFGTPWRLNAQGTGGGPKIEWPKNPAYPLEASPEALHDACVVWERERGDSLPHRQKKTDRAPSVGRPAVALCGGAISSCRVAQKNRGRGVLFVCGIAREFYGGRGTFSVRLNAEGDTPPVGIKRGDGRSNYYNTNLYYTALYFILLAALAIEKRDQISDLMIFILSLYLISYL